MRSGQIPEPPGDRSDMLFSANFEVWVDAIRVCLDAAALRLPPGTDNHALAQFDDLYVFFADGDGEMLLALKVAMERPS
jgi:hypothetical protein